MKKVALLGVAYKANVDDCRESPSFDVRDALQKVVYRNVPKSTRTSKVVVNEGAQSGNGANNNMES